MTATTDATEDVSGAWLPGLGTGVWPEPVPAERIRVPFEGPGSGRAALTWGQRDIWATMRRQRNWLPQGGRRPLEPGTTAEDVAGELAYLHGRYPSMRTRLAFGAETGVLQDIAASGETFLELYDARPGEDPDGLAARVEAVYRARPYDLRTEWPVRMAVVRAGTVCTHLVVLMHHLALDAGGAAVLMREVAVRETASPPGMQPLEQAAWQASEAGQRHNARVLRHFEDGLHTLPVGRVLGGQVLGGREPGGQVAGSRVAGGHGPGGPVPVVLAGPRKPRHWAGRFISPTLAAAADAVGARTGVDASSVLTALTGIALARLCGTGHVVIRPRVGNRFRPALVGVVCFVAQSGLLVLDLAGTTFDEAVERARRATLTAMKNAYFDPEALEALLARSAAEGRDPGIPVFFNDRRSARPGVDYVTEAAPHPRELQSSRGGSTFEWLHRGPEPTEPLSVTVDDAYVGLALALHFDTHVISPERVEELVWGIEAAAVEAAADGNVSTGL